jgi:hypothetical protein
MLGGCPCKWGWIIVASIRGQRPQRDNSHAPWARNEKGGHGPDAVPHDVPAGMAEAVLASAAVAIAYCVRSCP